MLGINTKSKIKLTPAHQIAVYVQGPPAPIHLRDKISVDLALLQNFNTITTLSRSKYSSPIFVHRTQTIQQISHTYRSQKSRSFPTP